MGHRLGNNLPKRLTKGHVTKWQGDPHHRRTQELWTNGMPLDPWWWLSLATLSRWLARFLSFPSFPLFLLAVSLCLHLNKWSINLFNWWHLTAFYSQSHSGHHNESLWLGSSLTVTPWLGDGMGSGLDYSQQWWKSENSLFFILVWFGSFCFVLF